MVSFLGRYQWWTFFGECLSSPYIRARMPFPLFVHRMKHIIRTRYKYMIWCYIFVSLTSAAAVTVIGTFIILISASVCHVISVYIFLYIYTYDYVYHIIRIVLCDENNSMQHFSHMYMYTLYRYVRRRCCSILYKNNIDYLLLLFDKKQSWAIIRHQVTISYSFLIWLLTHN